MSTFFDLLDAVGAYYGTGSDQWLSIAQQGINAVDAYSILSQTPNVNVTVSKSGDVLGYNVVKEINYTSQPAGSVIDSNAQLPATTDQLLSNYPAEMAINSQSGALEATSGMTQISTGTKVATVMSKVATAVGGVMAGCQLGAQCDSIAYQTAPDLWDEMGMSAVNPQTWDSICTTDLGKDLFNIVFGIDKESHVLQAYMDSRAVAQVAQYMSSIGAFGDGSSEATITPEHYSELYDTTPDYLLPIPFVECYEGMGIRESSSGVSHIRTLSASRPVYAFYSNDPSITKPIYFISSEIFSISLEGQSASSVYSTRTYKNKTFYYTSTSINATLNAFLVPHYDTIVPDPMTDRYHFWDICYILIYGTITGGSGIEGIEKQQDATFPTGITPNMTTDQVIGALSTQYPDMIQGALSNDVIQPDGSVKTFTYWPVGMPDNIPIDQITGALQPIGGVNTLQDDTALDPTKPEESLDTAIDLIVSPNPQNPTDRIEKTYPDTGDGETPSAVLPTGSAQALYAVYNPSQGEVNSFGAWLWDSNFFEQLKKLFNDPMQSIIGLHKIFATPSTSGRGDIYVGYLDSGVASNLVSNQYTQIDCGTVALYEYFGNALDYQATDVYLYLPFVGIVPLNVDDVTRAEINVKYKVDVLTGACLASVYVTRDSAGGQLYTYAGNCSVQYPLSSGSYMGIVASIAGVVGGVVGTIATGGAMLPVALGAGASALGSARTKVEHSGSLSGNAGAMGIKKPYLIIRRPQTAIADDYLTFDGGSENEKVVLGNHHGFTRVKYINIENVQNATMGELLEIETLLKDGVII